ncbi:GNAT family N-acetyltransferase [Bacillus solitudinis]|uniref:GNAT family N-acetyltransferase n=1 Tax=Bacillus solitudinis TaxID=2014074 RepID=UPI000C2414C8|nr:GNAT family N-acetyltransferase [Bacillus solitudinis]
MVNVFEVKKDADEALLLRIADLLMGQMEPFAPGDLHNQVLKTINLAIKKDSQAFIYAAEKDDQIVGAAFFNIGISIDKGGYYLWLNDLFVHKEHRNQGIAKKILLKIIYWAEQEDIKGIELETGINNEATKALYNSLGFYDIISKRYSFRF